MFVVGLGNPDLSYKNNRHNVGFMLIDRMVRKNSHRISACRSYIYNGNNGVDKFIKPQTYMNLSGNAVSCILNKYKKKSTDIIVCYDDMDISIGEIKLKHKGGSAGHKGIESIIDSLETDDFFRLRIGISKPSGIDKVEYVLNDFSDDERKKMDTGLNLAKKAIYTIVRKNFSTAQTIYNRGQDE